MAKVLIYRAFFAEYFMFLTLVHRAPCFEVKRQYMIHQFRNLAIYNEPFILRIKILNNNL